MIKKYLELYKLLLRQNIKMKLEFRTDFYISSLALIIVKRFCGRRYKKKCYDD